MALKIKTTNPRDLLDKIKAAINQRRIETWAYTSQNGADYFSHVTPDKQWQGQAWLKPTIIPTEHLVFNIIRPQNGKVSSAAYAVYHGRFAEMLLGHFDKEFSIVWATALPESDDLV